MLQKANREKILALFFKDPLGEFQLREISRETKIALPSVKNYLQELEKEELITKKKNKLYPSYVANRDKTFFFLKKLNTLTELQELTVFLSEKCMPDTIILFGSASRGEDVKDSDIDLFVLSKEEKVDLSGFEKKLSRKINVFFADSFGFLSKELKNNILNGVILYGYIKVF